ncbi:RICIN domain-containing protein [Kribbella sp. NPDC026611]|uniref:RICIN domain-containing protein n=1 Tax=Kribbella sp. NPDC026611 TaxID=3154911 RepID=UPI0033DF39F5
MKTRLRGWISAAIACSVVVAGLIIGTAAPASAGLDYNQIGNDEGYCLDSNAAGDVYLNPCDPRNPYQQWHIWNGGWTKNVATGRCLQADTYFAPEAIHTEYCLSESSQHFLHWQHGWYQRVWYQDWYPREAVCIARLAGWVHEVTGVPCLNPSSPAPASQTWQVIFLFNA